MAVPNDTLALATDAAPAPESTASPIPSVDSSVAPAVAAVDDWKPVGDWKSVGSATPKPPSALPTEPYNVAERVGTGMLDPLHGGKQLYEHALGTKESADAADKAIQEREKELRSRGVGESDLARTVGRIIPGAVVGGAAAPLGAIAGGVVGGVTSELLNPVVSGDYAEEKINQGLMGAAFGGGGGLALRTVGGIVGPTVREAASELMKQGIPLTPGQIAGGIVRRAEEAAKSFPVLGTFIKNAEQRSIEGFNKTVVNQALEPIGAKLPAGSEVGHEALRYAKLQVGDAYDTLLPKMQLTMDAPLASDISNIRYTASSSLPEAQYTHLQKILEQRVQRHFNDTGSIPGDALKEIERDLNSLSSSYRSSPDGAQRELAYALDDVRGAVRDALTRQNPKTAGELQKINESYAMLARVESAASRRATSHGLFTPGDLLQSIKSADKSVRKGAFARGDALMQDFAEFADTVLPSKMPDSGTTERAIWAHIMAHGFTPAALVGTAGISPVAAATAATALAPYTTIGGKIVNAAMRNPSAARQIIGHAIKAASSTGGGAATPIIHGVAVEPSELPYKPPNIADLAQPPSRSLEEMAITDNRNNLRP